MASPAIAAADAAALVGFGAGLWGGRRIIDLRSMSRLSTFSGLSGPTTSTLLAPALRSGGLFPDCGEDTAELYIAKASTRFSISSAWLEGLVCVPKGASEDPDDNSSGTGSSAGKVRGIKNEKRLPWSTVDSTRSCPPSCSTILETTARPNPSPKRFSSHQPLVRLVYSPTPESSPTFGPDDSTCSNSLKICSSLSGGIPQPVSATRISTAIC